MSVLTDMEARLVDANITTPIALARIPDLPDAVLIIREYPAERSRDFTARGLPVLERSAVQVVARVSRDAGVGAAEVLAWDAYRALSGRHVLVENGSHEQEYDWIIANHTPAHLGFDDNDRPLVVTNFSIQRWGLTNPGAP